MILRISLFLATNAAVLVLISVAFRLFGIEGLLQQNGVDLNLNALLIMSAIIGFGGSFVSLALSKWMAKRTMGVRIVGPSTDRSEQWLLRTVECLARDAGIGMPEVGIFDSSEPNAFATGMNRNNALVAVSSALLSGLKDDEVEAVLGHEISHVRNGDMVTMGLLQGVVNTFVIFLSRVIGHVIDRVVLRTERGYGPAYFITSIVAQVLLSFLATAIVMGYSRRREYRADAGAASLAGRDKMIAALRRLQAVHEPHDLPEQLAAFAVAGGIGQGLTNLFRSHPPLADRIAALEQIGD